MSTSQLLRLLQADGQVFYYKLHNLHWNVTGLMFSAVHGKTEELYNEFSVIFDDLAERQLQLKQKPIVTLRESIEVSRIKEIQQDLFTCEEALRFIYDDLEHFYNEFKKLSIISEKDSTTMAYADEKVAWLEKELWMLRATLNK